VRNLKVAKLSVYSKVDAETTLITGSKQIEIKLKAGEQIEMEF
jgi:hypothetical protein